MKRIPLTPVDVEDPNVIVVTAIWLTLVLVLQLLANQILVRMLIILLTPAKFQINFTVLMLSAVAIPQHVQMRTIVDKTKVRTNS